MFQPLGSATPSPPPRHGGGLPSRARGLSHAFGVSPGGGAGQASPPLPGAPNPFAAAPPAGLPEETERLMELVRTVETGRLAACRRAICGLAAKFRLYEATGRVCRCPSSRSLRCEPRSREPSSPSFLGRTRLHTACEETKQEGKDEAPTRVSASASQASGGEEENERGRANRLLLRQREGGRGRLEEEETKMREKALWVQSKETEKVAVSLCGSPVCSSLQLHAALAAALVTVVRRCGADAEARQREVTQEETHRRETTREDEAVALLQGLQLLKSLCESDHQYIAAFHAAGMVPHLNCLLSGLSARTRDGDTSASFSPFLSGAEIPGNVSTALGSAINEALQTLLTLSPAPSPRRQAFSQTLQSQVSPSQGVSSASWRDPGAAHLPCFSSLTPPFSSSVPARKETEVFSRVPQPSAGLPGRSVSKDVEPHAALFATSSHVSMSPPFPSPASPRSSFGDGGSHSCRLGGEARNAHRTRLRVSADLALGQPAERREDGRAEKVQKGGRGDAFLLDSSPGRTVVPAIVHDPRILASPLVSPHASVPTSPRETGYEDRPPVARGPGVSPTSSFSSSASWVATPIVLKAGTSFSQLASAPTGCAVSLQKGEREGETLEGSRGTDGRTWSAPHSRDVWCTYTGTGAASKEPEALLRQEDDGTFVPSLGSPRRVAERREDRLHASPATCRSGVRFAASLEGLPPAAVSMETRCQEQLSQGEERAPAREGQWKTEGGRRGDVSVAGEKVGRRGASEGEAREGGSGDASDAPGSVGAGDMSRIHPSDARLIQSVCEAFSSRDLRHEDTIRLASCLPMDVLPDFHPVARLFILHSFCLQRRSAASTAGVARGRKREEVSLASFCLIEALCVALKRAHERRTGVCGELSPESPCPGGDGDRRTAGWANRSRRRSEQDVELLLSLLRAAIGTVQSLREALQVAVSSGFSLPRAEPLSRASGVSASQTFDSSFSGALTAPPFAGCGCRGSFPPRSLLLSLLSSAFQFGLWEPSALPELRLLLSLCMQVLSLRMQADLEQEGKATSPASPGASVGSSCSYSMSLEEALVVGRHLFAGVTFYFPRAALDFSVSDQSGDNMRGSGGPQVEAHTTETAWEGDSVGEKLRQETHRLLQLAPCLRGRGATGASLGRQRAIETGVISTDELIKTSTARLLTPEQDAFLDIFLLTLRWVSPPLRFVWLQETHLLPLLLFFLFKSNLLFCRPRLLPLLLEPLVLHAPHREESSIICRTFLPPPDAAPAASPVSSGLVAQPSFAGLPPRLLQRGTEHASCRHPPPGGLNHEFGISLQTAAERGFALGYAVLEGLLLLDGLLALLRFASRSREVHALERVSRRGDQGERSGEEAREERERKPFSQQPAEASTESSEQRNEVANCREFLEVFAASLGRFARPGDSAGESATAWGGALRFGSKACLSGPARDTEQRFVCGPSQRSPELDASASGCDRSVFSCPGDAALFPLYLLLLGTPRDATQQERSCVLQGSSTPSKTTLQRPTREEQGTLEWRENVPRDLLSELLFSLVANVVSTALCGDTSPSALSSGPYSFCSGRPKPLRLLALLALLACPNPGVPRLVRSLLDKVCIAGSSMPALGRRPGSRADFLALLLAPDFVYELCVSGEEEARAFLTRNIVPLLLHLAALSSQGDADASSPPVSGEALCALDFIDLWDPSLLPPLLSRNSSSSSAAAALASWCSLSQLLRRLFSVDASVRSDGAQALLLNALRLSRSPTGLAPGSSASRSAWWATVAVARAACRGLSEAERGPRTPGRLAGGSRGESGREEARSERQPPALDPLGTAAAFWQARGRQEMQTLFVRNLEWRQEEVDMLCAALLNRKLDRKTKTQSLRALTAFLVSCPQAAITFFSSSAFFEDTAPRSEASASCRSAEATQDPGLPPGATACVGGTQDTPGYFDCGTHAPAAGSSAPSLQLLPSLLSLFFSVCVEAFEDREPAAAEPLALSLLSELLRFFALPIRLLPATEVSSAQVHALLERELVASGILASVALLPVPALCCFAFQLAALLLFSPFRTFLVSSRRCPLEPGLARCLRREEGEASLAAASAPAHGVPGDAGDKYMRLLVPCWATATYLFPLPLQQVQLRLASVSFWEARPSDLAFGLLGDTWTHLAPVCSLLLSPQLRPLRRRRQGTEVEEREDEEPKREEAELAENSREREDEMQIDREDAGLFFSEIVAAGFACSELLNSSPVFEGRDALAHRAHFPPWASRGLLRFLCDMQNASLSGPEEFFLSRQPPFHSLRLPEIAASLASLSRSETSGEDIRPALFVGVPSASSCLASLSAAASSLASSAAPLPVVGLSRSSLLLTPRVAQLLVDPHTHYFSLLLLHLRRPPPLRAAPASVGGEQECPARRQCGATPDDGGKSGAGAAAPPSNWPLPHPLDVPFLEAVKAAELLLRALSGGEALRGDSWGRRGESARAVGTGKAAETAREVGGREAEGDEQNAWMERFWRRLEQEETPPALQTALARLGEVASQHILPFVAKLAAQLASVLDADCASFAGGVWGRDGVCRLPENGEENLTSIRPSSSVSRDGEGETHRGDWDWSQASPSQVYGHQKRSGSVASFVRELDLLLVCLEFLLRFLPLHADLSCPSRCSAALAECRQTSRSSNPRNRPPRPATEPASLACSFCLCCWFHAVDVPRLIADLLRISEDLSTLRRRALDLAEGLFRPFASSYRGGGIACVEALHAQGPLLGARWTQHDSEGGAPGRRASRLWGKGVSARVSSDDEDAGWSPGLLWVPASRRELEKELLLLLETAQKADGSQSEAEAPSHFAPSPAPPSGASPSLRVAPLQGKKPVCQALGLAAAVVLPFGESACRGGQTTPQLAARKGFSLWLHAASYWVADSSPDVRQAAWCLLLALVPRPPFFFGETDSAYSLLRLSMQEASPSPATSDASEIPGLLLASLPPRAWAALLWRSAEAVARLAAEEPGADGGAAAAATLAVKSSAPQQAPSGPGDAPQGPARPLPAGFCSRCPECLAESVAAAFFLCKTLETFRSLALRVGNHTEPEETRLDATAVVADGERLAGGGDPWRLPGGRRDSACIVEESSRGRDGPALPERRERGRRCPSSVGLGAPPLRMLSSDTPSNRRCDTDKALETAFTDDRSEEKAAWRALELSLSSICHWLCSPRFLGDVLPMFLPAPVPAPFLRRLRLSHQSPLEAQLAGARLLRLALSLSPAPCLAQLLPGASVSSPRAADRCRAQETPPPALGEGPGKRHPATLWGVWGGLVAAVNPEEAAFHQDFFSVDNLGSRCGRNDRDESEMEGPSRASFQTLAAPHPTEGRDLEKLRSQGLQPEREEEEAEGSVCKQLRGPHRDGELPRRGDFPAERSRAPRRDSSLALTVGLESLAVALRAAELDPETFACVCVESPLLARVRLLIEGVLRQGIRSCQVEAHEPRSGDTELGRACCGALGRRRSDPGERPANPSASGSGRTDKTGLGSERERGSPWGPCSVCARLPHSRGSRRGSSTETTLHKVSPPVSFVASCFCDAAARLRASTTLRLSHATSVLLLRLLGLLYPRALVHLPAAASEVLEKCLLGARGACLLSRPSPDPATARRARDAARMNLWAADGLWMFLLFCIQDGSSLEERPASPACTLTGVPPLTQFSSSGSHAGLGLSLSPSALSAVVALITFLLFLSNDASSSSTTTSPALPQPSSRTCRALLYRLSVLLVCHLSTHSLADLCARALLPSPKWSPLVCGDGGETSVSSDLCASRAISGRKGMSLSRVSALTATHERKGRRISPSPRLHNPRVQRTNSSVSTPPRPRSAAFLSSPKPSLSPRAASRERDRRLEGRTNDSLSLACDAKGGVNERRTSCERDRNADGLCFELCEEDIEVQRLEDLLFEATALFFFFSPAVAFAVAWRLPLPAFEERTRRKTQAGTPLASPVFSATACVGSGTRRGEKTVQTLSSREQRHLLPMQILAEIELLAHGSTARAVINFEASERLLARQGTPQNSTPRSGLEEWFTAALLRAPLSPLRAPVGARRGEPRQETVASTRRHLTSSACCGELVERRLSRLLLLLALVCTSEGRKKKESGLREAVRERDAVPFGVAIAALKSVWRLAATHDHLRRVVLVFLQRCLVGPQSLSSSLDFFSLPRPPAPSFSASAHSSGVSSDGLFRCRLHASGLLDALIAASLDALERRDTLFLPSSSSRCYGSAERGGLRVSRAGSPLPADTLAALLFVVAASVSAKSESRTELLGFAAQLASHVKALLLAFDHDAGTALPQTSSSHSSASAQSRSPHVSSPRLAPHTEPTAAFEARLVGCLHCLRAICGVSGIAEDSRSLSCLFAASPLLSTCGDRRPLFAEGARAPQSQGDLSGWPSRCMQSPRLNFATKGHYATQAEIRETIDMLASVLLVPSLSFASLAALLAFLAACVGAGNFATSFASPLSKSARLLLLSSKAFLTVPAFLLSHRFSPALLDVEKEREHEREKEGGHKGSRGEQRRHEGAAVCLHVSPGGREAGELKKEKREKEDFLFWRAGFRALLDLLLATFSVDRRVAGGAQKMQKPSLCAALRAWRSRLSESAESNPKAASQKHTFSAFRAPFDAFACARRNGGEDAEDSTSDRGHHSLAGLSREEATNSEADTADETLLHLVCSVLESV
ncbi:UNVERIFIED_CONTAM: hypothetical protein HHA_272155 [Hammondia hammondi]|eukprot:XP_008882551.1 hypothetical protein HHA_272155 [Hammondia hammondi]